MTCRCRCWCACVCLVVRVLVMVLRGAVTVDMWHLVLSGRVSVRAEAQSHVTRRCVPRRSVRILGGIKRRSWTDRGGLPGGMNNAVVFTCARSFVVSIQQWTAGSTFPPLEGKFIPHLPDLLCRPVREVARRDTILMRTKPLYGFS